MDEQKVRGILAGKFNLDVVSFEKHNPGKTSQWFKMKIDWFDDPAIRRLPIATQLLYVRLLALRASKGGLLTNLCTSSLQHRIGFRGSSVSLQLVSLWKQGLISLDMIDKIDKIDSAVTKKPRQRPPKIEKPKPEPVKYGPPSDWPIDPFVENWLVGVKRGVFEGWLAAYPDKNWLCREMVKAKTYALNKNRTYKDIGKFLGNWFGNGWSNREPDRPAPPPKIDVASLFDGTEK